MKRHMVVLATLLAILWLPLGLAFGDKQTSEPGQQTYTARWTKTPAAVDGVIGPGEYSAAIPCHVELNKPSTAPGLVPDWILPPDNQDDLSYTIYAMYDDENLYIAVDVADDYIINDGPDDWGKLPWFDDDVEILLDGDEVGNDMQEGQPGKEGFQLLMDVGGDAFTQAGDDTIDWEAAVGLRPRGYLVEFRIALSSIDTKDGDGEESPGPESSVGFNVTVGDDDNGGLPYDYVFDPEQGFIIDHVEPTDSYGAWDGRSSGWLVSQEDDWGTLYFAPKLQKAPSIKPTRFLKTTMTWGHLKEKQ